MKFSHCKTFLLTAFILLTAIISFAQTEREKGIEFYKNGNYSQAINFLSQASKRKEYKNDAEIWNYIGLAYINQNEAKDARKSFEKAVKYAPENSAYRANLAYAHLLNNKTNKAQSEINKAIELDSKNANAYYIRGTANFREGRNERAVADAEKSIALDPKFTAGYILHSDSLLASFGEKWDDEIKPLENLNLLERAAGSLKQCLSDCAKDNALKVVYERAEAVTAFLDYFKRKSSQTGIVNAADENITPLTITNKPKTKYTDEARRNNETGNVRIAVMFGADGKTKYAMVIKGLRYGLNEQALSAASSIRFEPEKVDGKPVSVVKVVVYTFTIY